MFNPAGQFTSASSSDAPNAACGASLEALSFPKFDTARGLIDGVTWVAFSTSRGGHRDSQRCSETRSRSFRTDSSSISTEILFRRSDTSSHFVDLNGRFSFLTLRHNTRFSFLTTRDRLLQRQQVFHQVIKLVFCEFGLFAMADSMFKRRYNILHRRGSSIV